MNHKKANIYLRKNGSFIKLNDVTACISQSFHQLNKGFAIALDGTLYILIRQDRGNPKPAGQRSFDPTFDNSFK